MPRGGRACRRGHVVRRHVVHGARSARRHRLLLPGSRGERRWCLAAAHARPLVRPEDTLRQAVCATRTSRRSDVTRFSVTLSWTAERRSWPTSSSGAENVEGEGPPLTLDATGVTVTVKIRPVQSYSSFAACRSDVFVSFRQRTSSESNTGNF